MIKKIFNKQFSFMNNFQIICSTRDAAWLPGSQSPAHLDGSLVGDFGFDPLGLGKDPLSLKWYRQAELQHARWAMLATSGILVQSLFKPDVSFMEAGKIVAENSYASFGSLLVMQLLLMGWAEGRRWQDIREPGSTSKPVGNFLGFETVLGGSDDLGYPGGLFDPAGLSKNPSQLDQLKLKEIKNGRLAMLSYVGISCANVSTGKGPFDALQTHLSDPWTNNVMSNTYAIPILPN